jgi:hypothetical protein
MSYEGRQPQLLHCPKCNFTYVEIMSVTVETDVRASGKRYGMIKAEYRCEGCPGGTLALDFQKGQTFIEEA